MVGAGSVGAVAAASAAASGHRVLLCVRTPFPSLVIHRDGADHVVPATVLTSPVGAEPVDVVLLAVKVQDTEAAAPWLSALCGPSTVIGVLQNGLDPTPRLHALGPPVSLVPVVPTVAYLAAERTGPGRVTYHAADRVLVRAGAGADSVVSALGSELPATVTDDYVTAAWQKLVGNAVANTLTALSLRRVNVLAEPAAADLVRALVDEGVAVAAADGARLGQREAAAMVHRFTEEWSTRTSGSSMYYDRVAGRPLEHEALTGALVEAAHRHGVPVPHHETLLALLRLLDPAAERSVPAGG